MNIAKIKKACLDARIMIAIRKDGEWWLTNGRATWPSPRIDYTETCLIEVFEITTKEQDKMALRCEETTAMPFLRSEYDPAEESISMLTGIEISMGGVVLFETNGNELIVARMIDVAPALTKGTPMRWFLRRTGNDIHIVGYEGVLARVIVAPLGVDDIVRMQNAMAAIAKMPVYRI